MPHPESPAAITYAASVRAGVFGPGETERLSIATPRLRAAACAAGCSDGACARWTPRLSVNSASACSLEQQGSSVSEYPSPSPASRGRGNKAREKRPRLRPHPMLGAGKGRTLKWEECVRARARAPVSLSPTSLCLGSLPICRFKIPLEMAQATPALERHLSSTSGLQACPSLRCRFLLHSKPCCAPNLSAEGGAIGDAAAQELVRARTSSI